MNGFSASTIIVSIMAAVGFGPAPLVPVVAGLAAPAAVATAAYAPAQAQAGLARAA